MIRLVTLRNFPLVDLQIKRAYRRRCADDETMCAFAEAIGDDDLLWALNMSRRRSLRDSDWLNQLAEEVAILSAKPRKRSGMRRRRGVSSVSANDLASDSEQRSRRAG